MTDTLKKGMVLTMSLWGGSYETMEWLDGMTGCTGDCNATTDHVTFSNFKITPIPEIDILLQ